MDKVLLKEECLSVLRAKINVLKASIQEVQNSSNSETKSTAGDKHETSRAMAQLEVERLSQQLLLQEKLYVLLSSVPSSKSSKVESGALVKTNKGLFYPSVALGIIKYNQATVMALGMGAPISQLMLGLKTNDHFSFNGNKYYIEQIF